MKFLKNIKEFFFPTPIVFPKPTKTELIKRISNHQMVSNLLINSQKSYDEMIREKKEQKIFLAHYEKEFIKLLDDDFERAVAEAALMGELGLPEFFGDGVNLNLVIREGFNHIAHYLDPIHPLCIVPKKVEKSGREILWWLLSFGIGIESVEKSLELISKTISTKKSIVGIEMTNEEMQSFFLALITTSMSPEYGNQFRFLLNISRTHFEKLKEIIENPQI